MTEKMDEALVVRGQELDMPYLLSTVRDRRLPIEATLLLALAALDNPQVDAVLRAVGLTEIYVNSGTVFRLPRQKVKT